MLNIRDRHGLLDGSSFDLEVMSFRERHLLLVMLMLAHEMDELLVVVEMTSL